MGGAANNQLIMVKRPVDAVDLTGTDVIIDLTSDSNECVGDTEPLRPAKSHIEIPWISKLPKHPPSKKRKVEITSMDACFAKMALQCCTAVLTSTRCRGDLPVVTG